MMNDGAGGSYGDGSSYQGTARVGACTRPTKLGGSPWRLSKGEAGVSAASGVAWLCWTMQATPGRVLLPREPCLGPSSLAIYACLDARIGIQQAYWEKPCCLNPGIFLLLWLLREETAHCDLYQIRRPSSSCVS